MLKGIGSQYVLILLRSSFSAQRVQNLLLYSPSSDHPAVIEFDELLRSAVSLISNSVLSDDQWLQTSLPIKDGFLGISRVSSLATLLLRVLFLSSPESWLQTQFFKITSLFRCLAVGPPSSRSFTLHAVILWQVRCPLGSFLSREKSLHGLASRLLFGRSCSPERGLDVGLTHLFIVFGWTIRQCELQLASDLVLISVNLTLVDVARCSTLENFAVVCASLPRVKLPNTTLWMI